MNNKIKKFYDMATEYCSYIKKTKITKELVDDLLIKITNLYVSALELPNTSYDKEKIDYSTIKISVQVDEDINKYFELFDPYINDKPVGMMISDDLEDIYKDLFHGIKEYEKGNISNAVNVWKDTHAWHWGNHAINLIKALHQIRENNWNK